MEFKVNFNFWKIVIYNCILLFVGLYRGFAISVAGIFVYRAFYFGGYDAGKKFMFGDNPNPSIFYRFLFAQFITSSSEFLAYPLDTIRR
jgi:solute carrier family 25 (adenine nucleotide translocator) protein 4/5/6/31